MAMRDGSAFRARKSLHSLGNGKRVMVLSFLESHISSPLAAVLGKRDQYGMLAENEGETVKTLQVVCVTHIK